MKNTITLLLLILMVLPVYGQFKTTPPAGMERPAATDKSAIQINTDGINRVTNFNNLPSTPYATLPQISLDKKDNLEIFRDLNADQPVWIKGIPENMDRSKNSPEEKATAYLEAVREIINIENPENEFIVTNIQTDEQGKIHIRMQQSFEGVKIYGSEIMLHGDATVLNLFNGRYFPTPTLDIRQQNISRTQAEQTVTAAITGETSLVELSPEALKFVDGEPLKSTLMIYHPENNPEQPRLIWHVEIIPNITNRWEYFVDANSGEILFHHKNICQLFGWHEDHEHHQCNAHNNINSNKKISTPNEAMVSEETAIASDLSNVSRQFSVWRDGNTWLMIDASRNMYNAAQSNLPQDGIGVVGTFDANNSYPGQGSSINIVNHGNNNSWSRNEVSAHYNAGIAYEYFRTVFGRNSIKNQGENIFSVINVSDEDGNDMDNAFWNGETMFYGNGSQAFNAPLAKALDVAGHEMAHGVVQSTANLVYQGESGALNESFADIFGAMIDREDWQIGEEVANPNVFPTGTMRDMANPNNGGNSNNFYWQPAHYNERFTGSQDNGGVHINSGIPNHAYYLFATSSGIGKAKAEQIFYKALDDYLVMSSQFVDLRNAVIQAATDLHGNGSSEVAAAAAAFDAVGIAGGSGGDYQIDVEANSGDDFILWSDNNLSNINTSTALPELTLLGAFSEDNHISRPNISDDGTELVYVHADRSIRLLELDWSTGNPQIVNNFNLNNTSSWRNIVVSKDGTKIAALYGDLSQNEFDNEILVYDFISEQGQWFPLSNPTTADGLSTGDVLYADALEFDITGEFLLYDAFNQIPSSFGEDIEYWDIGLMKVWDNGTNNFANSTNPQISKIFNNLGEQVSVGNPTFAKNSPYVITFDHVEAGISGTNYSVYGVNIQTGEQGVIFSGNKPGYPSYSVDDNYVMFSITNNGSEILAFREVNSSKTAGVEDAFILIEDATWGAWYAIGERDLVDTEDLLTLSTEFSVLPNPSAGRLNLRYTGTKSAETSVKLYDALGQLTGQKRLFLDPGTTQQIFDLSNYPSGSYILQVATNEGQVAKRIVKK